MIHFTLDMCRVKLSVKQRGVPFFESLVWLDLGLNSGLPGHWQTLYSQDQWASLYIIKKSFLRKKSIRPRAALDLAWVEKGEENTSQCSTKKWLPLFIPLLYCLIFEPQGLSEAFWYSLASSTSGFLTAILPNRPALIEFSLAVNIYPNPSARVGLWHKVNL